MDSIVAEYEVVTRRNARPPVGFVTSKSRIDVRLDETGAVDMDDPVAFRYELAWKPDDALDEGRAPVTPPQRRADWGALKTTICPRFGSPNRYASRLAITRSLNRPWQKVTGFAQCNVGSIEGEGMRYGLATCA